MCDINNCMKDISAYNIGKLKNEAVKNDKDEFVFTETDQIKTFLECIAKGMPVSSACKYAQLDYNVIKRWLEVGKKDFEKNRESPYNNLYTREQRAEAVFEGRMLETITTSAKNGNWNAAMNLLKCRLSDTYNEKHDIKLEDDGINIMMDIPVVKKDK